MPTVSTRGEGDAEGIQGGPNHLAELEQRHAAKPVVSGIADPLTPVVAVDPLQDLLGGEGPRSGGAGG